MTDNKKLIEFLNQIQTDLKEKYFEWGVDGSESIAMLTEIKGIVELFQADKTQQYFKGYEDGQNDCRDEHGGQPQPDEKNKILTEFSRKISNQKNLHPKYQKLVSEHFWELIDVTDEPQPDDLVDALIDVGVNLANSKLVFGDIGIKNLQKAEAEIRKLLGEK